MQATIYSYDPTTQDYPSGSDTHNVSNDDAEKLFNTGEFGMHYQYLFTDDSDQVIGSCYSDSDSLI